MSAENNKGVCGFCLRRPIRTVGACIICYQRERNRAIRNGSWSPKINKSHPKKDKTLCVNDGCGLPSKVKGFCERCYQRDYSLNRRKRLRAAEEARVSHMWRVHEALEAHRQALMDRARPEDVKLWEATYDEP